MGTNDGHGVEGEYTKLNPRELCGHCASSLWLLHPKQGVKEQERNTKKKKEKSKEIKAQINTEEIELPQPPVCFCNI